VKAISLWQPWASLIAEGLKQTETRSWAPPPALIGERIAIHAAKRWNQEIRDAVQELWPYHHPTEKALPLGYLVATCRLGDALSSDDPRLEKIPEAVASRPYGDYGPGRFVWLLADIEEITPPIERRGRQGFFGVSF